LKIRAKITSASLTTLLLLIAYPVIHSQTQQKPELVVQTGHTLFVWSIAFSPAGKLLASGSADKTIKLWDVNTGRELRTLSGHISQVASVTFSPDGRTLASGSLDKIFVTFFSIVFLRV